VNPSPKTKITYTPEDLISSIQDYAERYDKDVAGDSFFGFPMKSLLKAESRLLDPANPSIAYFSMEYGLAPSIYNSFQLSRPISEKNQFFYHEVFSNYWLCDYVFKVKIDKMLDIPI